ncbi:MAG: SpoIIE family protein phosphatase [Candidatus Schekmanbacteria bacterium]|nr:SpoIIE family protein phosphatase [Candidatus Schekmanbacteria bacterium]
MHTALLHRAHDQLLDRRRRLADLVGEVGDGGDLVTLLRMVDAALERIDGGTYGSCAVCQETIDEDTLMRHPLIEYCLCRLNAHQVGALERDLQLAGRVQFAVLPPPAVRLPGWLGHFRYVPHGAVSGDLCDLVPDPSGAGRLTFIVGDVSGKGVAASFLMARLSALFRSLAESGRAVSEILDTVNRHISETTLPSHYATVVCGRAHEDGTVEIANAGHCPPLAIRSGKVAEIGGANVPIGLFEATRYATETLWLAPGDSLFLYTDGLTEARNPADEEFGEERLRDYLESAAATNPAAMLAGCLREQREFAGPDAAGDDLTVMVLRRDHAEGDARTAWAS